MFRLSTLLGFSLLATVGLAQTPCDQLKLSFPDATVTSIQFIPTGPFKAPSPQIAPLPAPESDAEQAGSAVPARAAAAPRAGRAGAPTPQPVPAYCRVMMILTPSSDSKIEAAVL